MKNLFARFIKEEEGQDLIEYALLAALVAIASIAILGTIGSGIKGIFTKVNSAVDAQT